MALITYRYRVKNLEGELNRMARAVNSVWNFCNDTQKHALKWGKKWPSGYDLQKLTSGSSKELGLPSDTIGRVCKQYQNKRRQFKRPYLRFRGRKNLGWIPLRKEQIKILPKGILFFGKIYRIWLSRHLPVGFKIKDGGSFSQDSKGHWYINIVLEVPNGESHASGSVGIDLGLKSFAVLSNGEKIEAPRYFRKSEERLAKAQRANKKRLAKNIHAKITNQRKDFLHKVSTNLANTYGHIVVGNINAAALAKTRMAKSVLDAGWSNFRSMLQYKAIARCSTYTEVSEAYTSVTCSECGCLSGPKGQKGLHIRQWECSECGSIHDRDVNSAILIARRAHPTLNAGTMSYGSAN